MIALARHPLTTTGGMFIVCPLYAILQGQRSAAEDHQPGDRGQQCDQCRADRGDGAGDGRVARPGRRYCPGIIGDARLLDIGGRIPLACWLLPETVIKALVRSLRAALWREVTGAQNMTVAVVVVNHVSFMTDYQRRLPAGAK